MRGGIFIAVGHLHSTSTSHLQPSGGESFSTDQFQRTAELQLHCISATTEKKAPGPMEAVAPEETGRCYALSAGRSDGRPLSAH